MKKITLLLAITLSYVSHAQSTFSTKGGHACTENLPYESEVHIKTDKKYRYITSNSIPSHAVGEFPTRGNPNTISPQDFSYKIPLTPKKTKQLTSVYSGEGFGIGRPSYEFGVAINGVNIEPSAMEAFENPNTGERNFEWTKEALSTNVRLGDDCNNAHVQPTGKYHYHGTPHGITNKADGKSMFLVAWAADGFPVYYKYGYKNPTDPTSELIALAPSYRLKQGTRPGDGVSTPKGIYDGTYVRDFEYVNESGDLDEANGRYGVTPEFPKGTYYYVITDDFPSIPRYFVGTPSEDFKLGGGHRRSRNNQDQGQRPQGDRHRPQGEGGGQRPPMRHGHREGGGRPDPSKVFEMLDINKDQKISKSEARGPLEREFDRIDSNNDGHITKEELEAGAPDRGGRR